MISADFVEPAAIRGTIHERRLAAGASTPWYVTRCLRGLGTNASNRSIRTAAVNTARVVPSDHLFFSSSLIRPAEVLGIAHGTATAKSERIYLTNICLCDLQLGKYMLR